MGVLLAMLIAFVFTAAMAVVLIFSGHRLWCAWTWRNKGKRDGDQAAERAEDQPWALPLMFGRGGFGPPRVTVQLPMYNEPYVAERVIRAVCAMDWPRDRLQVQVLDDSNDHTSGIVSLCCREFRGAGFDIQHIRRPTREGYKAGALQEGLRRARGELVAIFDADFVPPVDFLQRAVSPFRGERVGMVQACWSHLNEDLSWLARAQAVLLDGHFLIEHGARHTSGRWFNFNGTAGVWRRATIDSAGGWASDTLTEDVDLSYRAQLAGWRFVFLSELQCEAELPCRMVDLRRQQWRWTAGSIMAAAKLLGRIWRAEDEPTKRRMEATFHLLGPLVHVALLALAVTLGPMLWLMNSGWAWGFVGLLLAGALGAAGAFYVAASAARGRPLSTGLARLPVLLMLSVGLSVNNAAAVWAAIRGKAGGFVRTPKLRSVDRHRAWRRRAEELAVRDEQVAVAVEAGEATEPGVDVASVVREKVRGTFAWATGLTEIGLSGWCGMWAVVCATWWPGLWATVLLGLFAAGFAWVGVMTMRETAWAFTGRSADRRDAESMLEP